MFTRKNVATFFIILVAVIGVGIVSSNLFLEPENASASEKGPNYLNSKEEVALIPITNKMLIANNNYKHLHGKILIENNRDNYNRTGEIWIEQPNKFRVEYASDINGLDNLKIAVNNGDVVQIKDKGQRIEEKEPIKSVGKPVKIPNNGIVPDYNGTYLMVAPQFNELIHPEIFVQSTFRRGTLTTSHDTFLNRGVTKIELINMNSKIGDNEKFWIDNATGILLKREIYEGDTLLYRAAFESIDFSNIDSSKFELFK